MVKPWLDAGYDAITVDTQEAVNPHPFRYHWTRDVRELAADPRFPSVVAVFAFPPCTHFAVSGARWFKDKGLDVLIEALEIVNACRKICESGGAAWMLENPVGTLSTITETYWQAPRHSFNSNDYGDPYTKKTLLWTGGASSCRQSSSRVICFRPRHGSSQPKAARCTCCRHRQTGQTCAQKRRWDLHGPYSRQTRLI